MFIVVEGVGLAALSSPSTPPYQRLTQALQTDPRCAQEVALGRRVGLYRFCGDIGRGNFSRVKLAVHQLTRDKVAIKVVDRGRLDARALRMLSREVTTLECVHHPNILRLFEVVETLGRVHLVTEWIRGGELYHRITQGGSLKEIHAAPLYKQLLLAVKHMHNLGFVHRDIKAENVLLVTEDRIKLADFGFSTQLLNGPWQHLDTFCGSPPYAAPELFSDDHYIGGPVDVWALGVLLYFMVVGNMPFRAPTVPALRAAVLKGDYSLSPLLSLPCIRLIQRILVHTPSRRPTLDQMLASQWIQHINHIEQMNHQKSSKRTSLFFSHSSNDRPATLHPNKYKNRRGSRNNKDRSPELSHFTTIQCNTKRATSVLADNFLHPIENIQHYDKDLSSQTDHGRFPTKRMIFSGNLKKKIGPMEQDKISYSTNKSNNEIKSTNDISHDLSNKNSVSSLDVLANNATPTSGSGGHMMQAINKSITDFASPTHNPITTGHPFDEEQGNFIMLPTSTVELSHLHSIEIEARRILLNLGVNSDMLMRSVSNGPRSDIIGAYRIIIHRLQKQLLLAKQAEIIALEEMTKPKTNRTCAIL